MVLATVVLAPGGLVSAGPVHAEAACSQPHPGWTRTRTLRLPGPCSFVMAGSGWCGWPSLSAAVTGPAAAGQDAAAAAHPVPRNAALLQYPHQYRAGDAGTETGADALLRALPRCASGPGDSPRPEITAFFDAPALGGLGTPRARDLRSATVKDFCP